MNDVSQTILFWVSFVGYAMFVINSMYNIIVLRNIRKPEYQSSENTFSTIFLVLGVLFAVFALQMFMDKQKPPPEYVIPGNKEIHSPYGLWIPYTSEKKDTIVFYIEKKEVK